VDMEKVSLKGPGEVGATAPVNSRDVDAILAQRPAPWSAPPSGGLRFRFEPDTLGA